MSKRAEMRRKQKEQEKEQKTYTFTALELAQMAERIRKEERIKAKQEMLSKTAALADDILKMMIVIPVNVLISDFWEKSAKKRIPQFVESCMSLYDSYMNGTVKMSEMEQLTEEYAGIKMIQDDSLLEEIAEQRGNRK